MGDSIYVGRGASDRNLLLKYANRHGLITGATGTGKTITLQGLAEGFSRAGVPVFLADVKGDLAGISQPGGGNTKVEERAKEIHYALDFEGFPAMVWDLFGEMGHPIRTTVSDMGPLLLSRLLNLNDAQEGVLNLTFKLADDEGMLLLDLKDLRAMLAFVGDRASDLRNTYGNVSSATVGAIQRSLLVLEQQGGEMFFGEPSLDLHDLMRVGPGGRGYVSILAAERLMQSPRLYSTFLLWLLSELFEELPEIGDAAQPKLVFFFDEAHLLFSDAPQALVSKIEQVVRLIRSKGVGVYFISQSPADVPDSVLSQLGNRIQHALRAFTPREQKAVQIAAETFRQNPAFDCAQAISELAVGEALVSLLEDKGIPAMVERTLIRPPDSHVGTIDAGQRQLLMAHSPIRGIYDSPIDRDSAFERLLVRSEQAAAEAEAATLAKEEAKMQERVYRQESYQPRAPRQPTARRSDSMFDALAKSVVRSAGSQMGRQIMRGVLGAILKGR